ncbi:MAG: translation initiation factor IF-2 [Gammaproteobacteria bacterium HGW-Gammaproteobacteria-3]|nr:MAG: translation initiation factor IF-2 [Gammaproteobacteria bacterium HGW-Gammaproteobacteria-3]
MSDKTVRQLAEVVGIPLERLLEQLKEAGLSASAPDDVIQEDEKIKLLTHLRKRHGKASDSDAAPRRVTLKRRKVSELKQSGAPGTSAKTISIEVRKKKTYIKRSETAATDESKELDMLSGSAIEQPPMTVTQEEVAKFQVQAVNKAADVSVRKEAETQTSAPESEEKVELSEVVAVTQEPKAAEEILALKEKTADADLKFSGTEKRKELEKARRLEEAVERNAEKVRQLAAARLESQKKKKQAPAPGQADARKGRKKGRQKDRANTPSVAGAATLHQFEKPVAPVVKEIAVPEHIIVSDLAQKMSVKAAEIIKQLMKVGVMATINQSIDQDTAVLIVEEMGHKAVLQSDDALEAEMLAELKQDVRNETPRAPIVTIMGHVDHGKTSLLDYIRSTRVAAGEAGGITQHIGAYQVITDHGSVTFLDTPGHAAFTAMRARGAEVTDVVIVVVAADDGVMPQTREAVEHARAANVPIIVAINKIDKPEANPEKVMQELVNINVIPEEWGGEVQFIKVSAKTGEGIDDLIESLILQTEILELKASSEGPASGIVIESRLDRGRGAVATVLVQQGLLEKGQFVLCGQEYGRVRAMFNEKGKPVKDAGPSAPVEILGLSGTPNAGDEFLVVQNERAARELAEHREDRSKTSRMMAQQAAKLDQVFSKMTAGETATLNLVIKTDVQGSLEALRESLLQLSSDEVEVKVVFGGIGGINEGDANLALASGAILIGFNVRADVAARKLIEEKEIDLHYYSIIYQVIDEVKNSINGMLAPEIKENIVGLAEVRDVFRSPKLGAIAGCMVIEGYVKRNLPIRVLRDNVVIYEGQLESLRRFKDDVNEVKMGMECGIGVKNYNDVKTGDQIEVFERVEIKREL